MHDVDLAQPGELRRGARERRADGGRGHVDRAAADADAGLQVLRRAPLPLADERRHRHPLRAGAARRSRAAAPRSPTPGRCASAVTPLMTVPQSTIVTPPKRRSSGPTSGAATTPIAAPIASAQPGLGAREADLLPEQRHEQRQHARRDDVPGRRHDEEGLDDRLAADDPQPLQQRLAEALPRPVGARGEAVAHQQEQRRGQHEGGELDDQRLARADGRDQRAARGRPGDEADRPRRREHRLALGEVRAADDAGDGAEGGGVGEHPARADDERRGQHDADRRRAGLERPQRDDDRGQRLHGVRAEQQLPPREAVADDAGHEPEQRRTARAPSSPRVPRRPPTRRRRGRARAARRPRSPPPARRAPGRRGRAGRRAPTSSGFVGRGSRIGAASHRTGTRTPGAPGSLARRRRVPSSP